jgi:hypothetical protein
VTVLSKVRKAEGVTETIARGGGGGGIGAAGEIGDVFSKKDPVNTVVTGVRVLVVLDASVPLVRVRLVTTRSGLLLLPLNHWMAPATLVSATPFWVSASSWAR